MFRRGWRVWLVGAAGLLGVGCGAADGEATAPAPAVTAGASGQAGGAGVAGEAGASGAGEAGTSAAGAAGDAGSGGVAGSGDAGPGGEGGGGDGGFAGEGGAAGSGAAGEGSSGQAGAGAGAGGTASTEGVACGAPLPGPPLKAGLVEDNPGYEVQVKALDLSQLPETINLSGEGQIQRATVGFMLGKPGAILSFLKMEATGPLGEAVLYALAKSKGNELDFALLRQGLHSRYACAAGFPATLDGLKALYGDYTGWTTETLDSAPKCGDRRIWRNDEVGLLVAETLDGEQVRETEVLRTKGRPDGSMDFAVYTGEGDLTNRSEFATVGGGSLIASAPYTCMACHLNPDSMIYDVSFPVGTGACAK